MDTVVNKTKQLDKETLSKLQRMLGRASVNGGTARKMGPKGTVSAAQTFLANIQLKAFNVETAEAFRKQLDEHTRKLQAVLPKEDQYGQHWGAARKFLNIFLRNCAYNRFLSAEYGLDRIEEWMEVPLDKHVSVGLKRAEKNKAPKQRSKLPYWPGVIHLSPAQSDIYQAFASGVAAEANLARVHLDIGYWNAEPDQPE